MRRNAPMFAVSADRSSVLSATVTDNLAWYQEANYSSINFNSTSKVYVQ